jgi:hypothetical protein
MEALECGGGEGIGWVGAASGGAELVREDGAAAALALEEEAWNREQGRLGNEPRMRIRSGAGRLGVVGRRGQEAASGGAVGGSARERKSLALFVLKVLRLFSSGVYNLRDPIFFTRISFWGDVSMRFIGTWKNIDLTLESTRIS